MKMVRNKWYEALAKALEKDKDAPTMQLATFEAPNRPRVRTLIQRSFLFSSAYPTVPLILYTTDVRTPKVTQLAENNIAEAVYWTPHTQEQFRILGRASIVPHKGCSGGYYPKPKGVVYDALEREGFDWEAKRLATFDGMSGQRKASWCRPVPGTPLTRGEDEMKEWPEWLPKLDEAETEEEKRLLRVALSNFSLLVIEPFEVDYVELGLELDRRTRFERDWEDEQVVEFRETSVVP